MKRLSLLLLSTFLACSCSGLASETISIQETKTRASGNFLLNNNVWGKEKSPNGWQVVDLLKEGEKLSWRVRYNWPVGSDKYSVKCYPSVVNGWQWGTWSADKRLPKNVRALKLLRSGGNAVVHNPGVQNIAYDLWFHAAGPIDQQPKPSDELMIWTNRFGGAGPLGTLQAEVEISGAKWSLYVGDIGWKVFSFVRTEGVSSWDLDVKAFIDCLLERKLMESSKQLTGIQFGTEVFSSPGDASVTVNDYSVDIE